MSNHRMSTPEASKALGIPVHVITYWLGQIPYPAEQDDQGQWRLTPEAIAVLQTVKDLKEHNHSMDTIRRHVRELQDTPPVAQRPLAPRSAPAVVTAPPVEAGSPPPAATTERAPQSAAPAPRKGPAGPTAPGGVAAPAASASPRPPAAPPSKAGATPPAEKPQPPSAASSAVTAARLNQPVPTQPAPMARPLGAPVPVATGYDLANHVARAVTEAVRQETMLAQRYAHAAHQIGKLEAENEHLRQMLNASQIKHARELDDARGRVAELEARPAPKPKTPWWAWLSIAVML